MKQLLLSLVFLITITACDSDDGGNTNDNNPFLTPPIVNLNLSLNLPQFNALNFPGSTVVLPSEGIRGIVVYNKDNSSYFAFDLTDPNHLPSSCSGMDLEGIIATCPCSDDSNSYGLAIFGLHENDQGAYPMLSYRVQRNGDNIIITN